MPLTRSWTEITVEEDLLPQVIRELLELADDANQVEVQHGTSGRFILAETDLAERWFDAVVAKEEVVEVEAVAEASSDDPEVVVVEEADGTDSPNAVSDPVDSEFAPLPVKRGPGRPRKNPLPFSASDGEES